MSDHQWTQENLAVHLAGGLDADEQARLEAHVAACPECAGAFEDMSAFDRKLETVFTAVRPRADLEDVAIRHLRMSHRMRRFQRGLPYVAAAAVFAAVTIAGAGIHVLLQQVTLSEQVTVGRLRGGTFGVPSMALLTDGSNSMSGQVLAGEDLTDADGLADALRQDVYTKGVQVGLADGAARNLALGVTEGRPLARWAEGGEGRPAKAVVGGGSGGGGFGGPGAGLPVPAEGPSAGPSGGGSAAGSYRARAGFVKPPALGDSDPAKTWGRESTLYFRPADHYSRNLAEIDKLAVEQRSGGARGGDVSEKEGLQRAQRNAGDDMIMKDIDGEAQKNEPLATLPPEAQTAPAAQAAGRKIIRSGEIDFEVDSFDDAVAVIQRLIGAAKGGFIATINSDKLANGKVKGSVAVRIPPEQLDAFVLGLRKELAKAGDLKGQRIGSQDITKQYTDLESRLKAARTMEERLLKIIQEGKGVIKDLLLAEKELGTWRTRIEEMEGELRYYSNMVSLSSLTINLTEKEIRVAAAVTENERVQAGIEVEDVEKAYRTALTAITEAKGRVTRSELKQHSAGQFNALLHFEVGYDNAGVVRDRLRQLGHMVRLEIDRVQHAVGGGKLPVDGKLERGPTQFQVSLYNLANIAPRETVVVKIAAVDVPAAYRALRDSVAKAQGRVINAQLNEQDRQNVTAQLDFDLRRVDEALPQAVLAETGETLSRHVSRVPEGENVTDTKVLYKVEIVSTAHIEPRETVLLGVEVDNVKNAQTVALAQVKEAQGRVIKMSKSGDRSGQYTVRIIADVPFASATAIAEQLRNLGRVRADQVAENQQAPSGRLAIARLDVTLSNELLVPHDEGLWAQLRYGVSVSLRGLALSAGWLIIGVLFVLPWLLLVLAAVWLIRRLFRAPAQTPAPGA